MGLLSLSSSSRPQRVLRVASILLAGGLVAALMACGVTVTRAATSDSLRLVAFAGARAANDPVQAAWARTTGQEVSWLTSFGASGDQSRAVASGLPADVVHLSLISDIDRLAAAGLVDADRTQVATRSVVVIVVREGNPKNIRDWSDLIRQDVSVITANPGSSGAARWNILAAYAAAGGNTPGGEAAAREYLGKLFRNVVSLPGSGRDATTAFVSGTADVLISQEQEAIFARSHGAALDYVIPATTVLVENPATITTAADPRASAYLDFLLSEPGQRAVAQAGFRPAPGTSLTGVRVTGAHELADPFPALTNLVTVDDFGGWQQVNTDLFNSGGVVNQIQREVGAS